MDGALSLKARGVMPTVSGPNWGSMLTGAGPEQHGITNNNWTTDNYTIEATIKDEDGYFPSIFSVIRKQMPNAKTAFFYDWKDLIEFYNEKYIDKVEFLTDYIEVYKNAIDYVIEELPEFTFIYVGHIDEVGHEYQHGSDEYYKSIEDVDAKIGELISALEEANLYESMHIILVSDHGGVGYGHGGESMDEIQVPWLIKGPGIIKNKLIEEPLNTFYTASTIAYLFNLKQPEEWIGKPVLGAFVENDNSKKNTSSYLPKPKSSLKSGLYSEDKILSLSVDFSGAVIRYTIDGTEPDVNSILYSEPIILDQTKTIKFISLFENSKSTITELEFKKVLNVKNAELITKPSSKYPAEFNGISLIDKKMGDDDYNHSAWMGFEVDDFEAVLDLGMVQLIDKVSISCLENHNSWIFLPQKVSFYISNNKKNFMEIGKIESTEIKSPEKRNRMLIEKNFENVSTQYIKVLAENIKYCPKGHKGEGGKAWLFLDEIIIE
jgi:hypothetical protein